MAFGHPGTDVRLDGDLSSSAGCQTGRRARGSGWARSFSLSLQSRRTEAKVDRRKWLWRRRASELPGVPRLRRRRNKLALAPELGYPTRTCTCTCRRRGRGRRGKRRSEGADHGRLFAAPGADGPGEWRVGRDVTLSRKLRCVSDGQAHVRGPALPQQ